MQWIRKTDAEEAVQFSEAYRARAHKLVEEAKGRTVYRPSTTSSIGILGAETAVTECMPRSWVLKRGLATWSSEDDVKQWASDRGFTMIENGPKRAGNNMWTFNAVAPSLMGTFSFASKVLVVEASKTPKGRGRGKSNSAPPKPSRQA